MAVKNFKTWLESVDGVDVFGFEKEMYAEPKNIYDEKPVKRFSLQRLMDDLCTHSLGSKQPVVKNISEIHWGEGPGAIRIKIGTGLNVMFDRMNVDLQGANRWGTKKVYQILQSGYGGHEDAIAEEMLDIINEINQQPLDSASRDYNDLELLVTNMANAIRKTAKDIFMFEGVRKVDADQYILRLSVRAGGVGPPDHQRIVEHQTLVYYDKDAGLIRMIDYNLETGLKGYSWGVRVPDTDWYFFPTQPREEIVETIANTLYWY